MTRIIAHRGNLNGWNGARENTFDYIKEALDAGFDVEVDVLELKDMFTLVTGHDFKSDEFPLTDLIDIDIDRVWFHCKNLEVFLEMRKRTMAINYFFHDTDEATLTRYGDIWLYPKEKIIVADKTVNVLPERHWGSVLTTFNPLFAKEPIEKAYAFCTDFPIALQKEIAKKNV